MPDAGRMVTERVGDGAVPGWQDHPVDGAERSVALGLQRQGQGVVEPESVTVGLRDDRHFHQRSVRACRLVRAGNGEGGKEDERRKGAACLDHDGDP